MLRHRRSSRKSALRDSSPPDETKPAQQGRNLSDGTLATPPDEIAAFLDQLVYERGLSGNTRAAYGNDLAQFWDFAARRGASSLRDVKSADIVAFLGHEQDAGFNDTTIARRFAAIRALFAWLTDDGRLPANNAKILSRPKVAHHLPETLAEPQVSRLLATAAEDDSALGLRNRAILELLYACGLRASELVGLTLDDVRLGEAFLRCTGKGGKQRIVPIGTMAVNALRDYLRGARPALAAAGPGNDTSFFLTKRGTGMCRETLWRVVEAAADKAGLAGEVHPHTLRHCFASHLLAHGANIRAIQEMLGHADIATTQIYTHVDAGRLVEIHRKFHPRA